MSCKRGMTVAVWISCCLVAQPGAASPAKSGLGEGLAAERAGIAPERLYVKESGQAAVPLQVLAVADFAETAGATSGLAAGSAAAGSARKWTAQLKEGRTPEARVEAAQSLCEAGPKNPTVLKALIAALSDVDARVRHASVDALGCLQDPGAVSPLIAVSLRDRNPGVRELAANVLGHGFSTSAESVVALMAALKDRNASVRAMAAGGLNNIKDPRALGALLDGLRDPNPNVRAEVARALGRLGDPRALDPLLGALKDADPTARAGAINGLGDLGDPRALGLLRAALKSPDARVRGAAARALGTMKDAASARDLRTLASDQDAWVRYAASFALYQMGLGAAPEARRTGPPPAEPSGLPPDDGGPSDTGPGAPSVGRVTRPDPPADWAPPADAVRVAGPIKMPRILSKVQPEYPEQARLQGVAGIVVVEALINTRGEVAASHILRGIAGLDQAALDAVRQWTYEPTSVGGRPVPVIVTLTINFQP